MQGDLHCHSRYSDGSSKVEDIIVYAKRFNLDYIALTDHDTMAGVPKAVELGAKCGLSVIPAVECSCFDNERNRAVHVLCYNPKDIATLNKELQKTLNSRRNQKFKIIEKLQKLYPIKYEDVFKYCLESESIYECHIMQALADLGYTNTVIGSFMAELMSPSGSCFVPTDYIDVREIVKLISDVGGVAVVAHPEEYDSIDLVLELAEKKLIKGVEVFHPRNSDATRISLLEIAKKFDLLTTGGSDFHGQFSKRPNPLGTCTTDEKTILKILSNI